MIKRTLTAALFLLGVFLLSDVPTSESHGYIVRSIPSDRTVVTRAPNKVQVWFSEGLEPKFSTIEVVNQRGSQVDLGDGGTDKQNSAKLVVSLPSDLPQGVYLVKLRPVFASDGHAVEDTLVFWVGEQVGDFNEAGGGNTAVTLEAVWRILLTLALTVLHGTFLMYALVLRPAWGNLPPRVMRRLSLLVWSSLVTAILVNGLALIQMTLTLFDDIFQGNTLSIVLQGTNFGDVWQSRMVLLVSILGIQIIATQQSRNRPGSTHILWLVNSVLALLTLGTMSLISHASGSPVWPLVSLLMDYLHFSAVASWVGGLIVLALILRPALTPLLPEKRGQALLAVLKRFSRLALVCVSLIIATGMYAASINMYQVENLTGSTYGLTLLAKLILMLPLFTLGAVHFLILSPERGLYLQPLFARLPQTLPIETLFALVVLLAAALLPATPPPQPSNARGEVEANSKTVTVEGYEVTLTVSPGAVGANSFDVNLTQNSQAANVDGVKIRFSYPERGFYTPPLALESSEPGLWVGASGDIHRAGTWDALIDIEAGSPIRAALEWTFEEEVTDASTRAAGIFNWLSLLVVIVVGAVWIVPPSYRLGKALDWTPQTAGIAIASILFTLAIIVGGAILFSSTSRRLEAQRNPVPDVINPIFADQNSLAQGRAIYDNRCVICHGSDGRGHRPAALHLSRPILPFEVTLPTKGDDDLYRLLTNGIVGRHFFGTDLSEEQRWHLINFIRQLESSLNR